MGDFSEHLRVMKRKADTFAGYIKSPHLKTHDIRVFHNMMYTPSMRYSLPAVAVDEEEFGAVQAQIIPSIVQRLDFNSNLPTAIRFGPIEMGGLGLVDLRTEGGIEMLKYFWHTIYSGTEVGDMLLMHVQTSQLESDQQISLLTDPTIYIPYLTAPWVMSLRQFMSNHKIEIDLTQTLTLSLKSATDEFNYASSATQRLFHPAAERLEPGPDLSSGYFPGRSHGRAGWTTTHLAVGQKGGRPSDFFASKSWPRQESISKAQQRLWRRYIASQFLRYNRYWRQPPNNRARRAQSMGIEVQTPKPKLLSSMIKTLPKHQRRLLSHVKQRVNDDVLWSTCRTKKRVTIASDGGLTKGRQGTFGWNLSTNKNQSLFKGAGPADGPYDTANSTRCELARWLRGVSPTAESAIRRTQIQLERVLGPR